MTLLDVAQNIVPDKIVSLVCNYGQMKNQTTKQLQARLLHMHQIETLGQKQHTMC